MVCENCNLKMVPANEISRKTFKVSKGRALIIGELLWFKVLNEDDIKPIFSLYAAKDVTFHETNEERLEELLKTDRGDLLTPPCEDCIHDYRKLEKTKHKVIVKTGEELVFKGLGWISVKRGPLNIEITAPRKAGVIIRDAFIKPKR